MTFVSGLTIGFISGLIGIPVVLIAAYILYKRLEQNIVPSKYEWLTVLNINDWFSASELQEMMRCRKGSRLYLVRCTTDMWALERENLVELQYRKHTGGYTEEYRLTQLGVAKRRAYIVGKFKKPQLQPA